MNSNKSMNDCFLGIDWDVADGRLFFHAKQNSALSFKNLSGSVSIGGKIISLKDADIKSCKKTTDTDYKQTCVIEFLFKDLGIVWVLEVIGTDRWLELTGTLKNNSRKNINVSDWKLLHAQEEPSGIIDLGNDQKQVRFFGWNPWDMRVERFAQSESMHTSDTVCHLYDPSSGITLLAGFVTVDRMETRHSLCYTETFGITEYSAVCSFGEYRVGTGLEIKSETLRISYHDNPYVALECWADYVHDYYRPSFEGTLGVCSCGGAWIDAFTCEEPWSKILLETAMAIQKRLKGFDINCLTAGTHQIMKGGLPGNWLTFEDAGEYEGGYKALFEKLHQMGFIFKLWFSPFWFFGEADGILDENSNNLLVDEKDNVIMRKWSWEFDRSCKEGNHLTQYYLDGTHPKTKEYLARIFKEYRAMGARAYMLDFLNIPAGAKMYDDKLLPLEAGRKILEVIREAAGDDTHLQTAVASTPGFVGCINAARIGRDYGEGRPMYPFENWQNATYCMHDHHFSNDHLFIQNAMASWFTHRKIYVNDLNSLTVDKPVPLEHARISATMFALSGDSPMVLGDDIRTIDPERLRILKMCLPRTKGIPVPVDLFENVSPENYCHIIKKAIKTKWDSYLIAVVFNTDDTPYSTNIDFSKLGLYENENFRIFEFWNEEYMGTYRESYSCVIPPHACRVFRISRSRQYPWLLSTDMHVEQGAAEVRELEWNEETMILRGAAMRPAGEKGNLFFLIPRQLKLINHDKANIMKEVIDMQTVIRLPLEFKNDQEAFELRFELMDTSFVARNGWLAYATEKEWLKYIEKNHKLDDTRVIK